MAAVDYFLKIEGIEGSSTDHKHKNEIQLESWSWGETQSGTHHGAGGGGGGAGKVQMQDFHFVQKMSKASAKLFLACATGEHLPKAVLTCRKAGTEQQEFLKVTMTELLVSSYQTGGSGHSDILPTDQISINFSKIEFEYKEQDAKGMVGAPVKAGYDVKAGKKV